ncbi:MAG: hypothetical protein ACYC1C_03490 [Chloroflexota bacterium]|nr:hypothetical protein [Actinomycetota bacterium]MDA8218300.1 hypothetical protein [Dehalococcoidales bacterium]
MMIDRYETQRPAMNETVEVICRNCGRKRHAVWVVARLLRKNEEGQFYTEVCHECLNEDPLHR